MMFVEPRFRPLGTTFVDDEEEVSPKPRLVRRHSFSGYIPYHLDEEVQSLESLKHDTFTDSQSQISTDYSAVGSENKYKSESGTWQDEWQDDDQQAWPETDDEWELQAPARSHKPQDPQEVQMDEQIVRGLGKALAEAAADQAQLASSTCFYSNTLHRSSDSIESYVQQLHRDLKSRLCGNSRLWCVYALAYISQAAEMNPGQIEVNSQTAHRLVLTALTIAVKFHSDIIGNQIFAEVSGLPLEELNIMEAKLLELMHWQVSVDSEDVERMQELLCIAGSDCA